MKLRLKGSALRLRVARGEVAALARGERVVEATAFGPGPEAVLRCVLEVGDGDGDALRARLDGACITVTLPRAAARRWAGRDDEVGLAGEQPVGEGGATLSILVEKDFPCAGRGAEEPDAFPRPGDAPRC